MKTQRNFIQHNSLSILCALSLLMVSCLIANPIFAQRTDRTVTGVVRSLDGPLLGATIVLKGTTIGVMSNDDGAFTFPKKLTENDVLVVSYLGYKSREVTIQQTTSFIEPFLEDIPIVIKGSLRTINTTETIDLNRL